MSGSQQRPWSDNPNAPVISYSAYLDEKAWFAGTVFSSVLYGIVVVLFFKCMVALFNPDHRRGEPVNWGLVSYTVVMFLLVTVETTMNLDVQSLSYINNREFPGFEGLIPPGPYGYQLSISPEAISIVPNVMFLLNNWLADGLLLYRCYVIYSTNLWVIAFPCLMYFSSLAMGILLTYQYADQTPGLWAGLPYFSVSLSLNVLLTLMIIIRLILHARNTRTALGMTGIGEFCKAIIAMLVESSAIYAVSSLLVIGPWGAGNYTANAFFLIIAQTQVIAPLLIIQRVADKSVLTNSTAVSAHISEFKAGSRGRSTDGSGTLPGGVPMSYKDECGTTSGEPGAEVEMTAIDLHRDKVGGSFRDDSSLL